MQTLPTAANAGLSGGTQQPLLTEEQLVVGAFLAGNTMQSVWRILDIDRTAGTVTLERQVPGGGILRVGHTHEFTLHRNTTCVCGVRLQSIRGPAGDEKEGILPLRLNTPRVYVIAPSSPLVMPDVFTVYLTAGGQAVRVSTDHTWSMLLPIVPVLYPVWTLPEPLRARLAR